MSRKIRDYIDEAIAAGAFVLPPKPVEEESPVTTPEPPYTLVERKPNKELEEAI